MQAGAGYSWLQLVGASLRARIALLSSAARNLQGASHKQTNCLGAVANGRWTNEMSAAACSRFRSQSSCLARRRAGTPRKQASMLKIKLFHF